MKLVTFVARNGTPRLGALDGAETNIVDAQDTHTAVCGVPNKMFSSMQALIEGGAQALSLLSEIIKQSACVKFPSADVKLMAPLPRPEQIRDCLAFKQHVLQSIAGRLRDSGTEKMSATQEQRLALYDKRPHWYKCNRMSVRGHNDEVIWPSYSSQMDYELELALVVGQQCRNLAAKEFRNHVFGYTIFNDFSARDVQNEEMAMLGPNKSKDFDTGNVFGPCIVTADSFDPADVEMITRINGEVQSSNRSSTMTWSFAALLAAISDSETIYPGEIICSGTVGGGSGLETGRYLHAGDVIELEVEGIGVLRNRVQVRSDL